MNKNLFLKTAISLMLLVNFAKAETVNLSCNGSMGGQHIAEEQYAFDMSVDDKTGNMSLPASPSGCYDYLPDTKSRLKASCTINSAMASCKCESFWGTSFIRLSRSTAKLTIEKLWKDNDQSKGIFDCTRVTKKVF